jgi:hypothetical protein
MAWSAPLGLSIAPPLGAAPADSRVGVRKVDEADGPSASPSPDGVLQSTRLKQQLSGDEGLELISSRAVSVASFRSAVARRRIVSGRDAESILVTDPAIDDGRNRELAVGMMPAVLGAQPDLAHASGMAPAIGAAVEASRKRDRSVAGGFEPAAPGIATLTAGVSDLGCSRFEALRRRIVLKEASRRGLEPGVLQTSRALRPASGGVHVTHPPLF